MMPAILAALGDGFGIFSIDKSLKEWKKKRGTLGGFYY
jgi:hypothetical protein